MAVTSRLGVYGRGAMRVVPGTEPGGGCAACCAKASEDEAE